MKTFSWTFPDLSEKDSSLTPLFSRFLLRGLMWHWFVIGNLGIILFTASPILSAMVAGYIGELCGCRVDEAGVYPCVVMGIDIGGILSTMFVLGWAFIFTIFIGPILIVVWNIFLLFLWDYRSKKAGSRTSALSQFSRCTRSWHTLNVR